MSATLPDPNSPPAPPPQTSAPPPQAPPQSAPPAPAPTAPPAPPEQPLGEPGLRALQAERDARAAAERRATAAEQERDRLRQAQESEADKLKREAEEGRQLAAMGATAIRSANLLTALAGKGLAGPTAMAASRLLDGVEFDAQYQPTNLDARLEAAKATYGEQHFAGATPAPAPPAPPAATPPGPGNGHPPMLTSPWQTQPQPPAPAPQHPDLHGGPRPPSTAADEEAQFQRFMSANFPGVMPPQRNP